MTTIAAPAPEQRSIFSGASPSSWWALLILIAVGLYMFADRNVIVLQTEPMRAALGLTDLQIGLIQGLSVALFAAFAGYPIAWLADRFDVRGILSISILIWCGAVAACGLAQNFEQLFLASMLVGAGEAGLLPITYAAIPELFKGRARVLANAMVTLVGRVASGGVIIISGLLVQYAGSARSWLPAGIAAFEDWRLALLLLALPGPLFAILVLFLKLRSTSAAVAAKHASPGRQSPPVLPFLTANFRTIGAFYFGVGLLVFGMSALGAFLPVVAIREMGAQPAQVGGGIGTATLISSIVAIILIMGVIGRLSQRFGARFMVYLLGIASLGPALLAPGFLFVSTPMQLYVLLGIGFLFLSSGAMAFPTVLQELTPRASRARLISISILLNIVLSALAPAAVGALSDALQPDPSALRIATVTVATIGLLLSSALIFLCSVRYTATTAAARAAEADEDGDSGE